MGKTRREALRNLTKRLPSQNLADVAGSIIQAEQLGTPLGTVLKVQATVLRTKRTQTAEKAAQQAPVKIIFPLLFIFSATFLMLFGGFIVRWIRGEIF
jgi:tight adherence protein C